MMSRVNGINYDKNKNYASLRFTGLTGLMVYMWGSTSGLPMQLHCGQDLVAAINNKHTKMIPGYFSKC